MPEPLDPYRGLAKADTIRRDPGALERLAALVQSWGYPQEVDVPGLGPEPMGVMGGPQNALMALAGSVSRMGKKPAGIRAYHGSPHDFDKFSMDKIGSGEGAQALGHGLYFSENPNVAEYYRNYITHMVTDWNDPKKVAQYLVDKYGDAKSAIANTKIFQQTDKATRDAIEILKNESMSFGPRMGRTYEVDIRANPNEFLDWDKPLSEQGEGTKNIFLNKILRELAPDKSARPGEQVMDVFGYPDPMGERIYRHLDYLSHMKPESLGAAPRGERVQMGGSMMRRGPETSSGYLSSSGIPGIRYLDQMSRGAGEGTRNYVLFRDDIIDIIRKYGIAALLGGGAAGSMSGTDAEAQK